MKHALTLAALLGCAPAAPAAPKGSSVSTPLPPATAVPVLVADAGTGAQTESARDASANAVLAAPQGRGAGHKLALRWTQSWNRHWAAQAGADGEHSSGAVTIDLDGDGHTRVTDRGDRARSVLNGDRYSENKTAWRTSWRGTWTLTDGTLNLKLTRDQATCSLTATERRGTQQFLPTTSTCSADATDMVLECAATQIEVRASLDDLAGKSVPETAWSCTAVGPATTGTKRVGTPLRWVLGKSGCVETTGDGMHSGPIRYARCKGP